MQVDKRIDKLASCFHWLNQSGTGDKEVFCRYLACMTDMFRLSDDFP